MPICPHCQTDLGGNVEVTGQGGEPEVGDLTFCFECGRWATFGPDDTMVMLNADDEKLVAADPFFRRVHDEWVNLKIRQ